MAKTKMSSPPPPPGPVPHEVTYDHVTSRLVKTLENLLNQLQITLILSKKGQQL